MSRSAPRRGRILPGALLAGALLFPGCASYSQHLIDEAHPWHAVPSWVGLGAGYVGVYFPVGIVEGLLTGSRNLGACPDPGPLGQGALQISMGLAWVLGTPFYLLGLPFDDAGYGNWDGEPPPIPSEFWEPPPIPPEFRDPPPAPKTDAP